MPPKIADVLAELEAMKKMMITKDDLDRIKEEVRGEFLDELAKKDNQISHLEDKLAVCEGAISTLKKTSNRAEQYSRRQSLRFFGVERARKEKAEDCLEVIKKVIAEQHLDIPDVVIDRAHRIGNGKNGSPPPIIVKFTTWRHRTMLYRARQKIKTDSSFKITLDITKDNIEMMNKVKALADEMEAPVEYVFCDVNCQPTIKTSNGSFLRFDSVEEASSLLQTEMAAVDQTTDDEPALVPT